MNLTLYIGSTDYSFDSLSTIIDSSNRDSQACITVKLENDDILEDRETFTAVLTSSNAQVNADGDSIEITIDDNDGKFIL